MMGAVNSDRVSLPCVIEEHASLRRYNTFGVEARARWLVRLRQPSTLPEVLARPEWAGLPVLVSSTGEPKTPAHAIGVIRDEHHSLAAVMHAWMHALSAARAADTARANSADWRTAAMPPLNV